MWKAKAVFQDHSVVNLNKRPLKGDFVSVQNKADELCSELSDVIEIQYWKFTCISCEHCQFEKWVPYHPLFICTIGGQINKCSTLAIDCPEVIEVT